MKKVLALILALVMCLALVACGDSSEKKETEGKSELEKYMEKNSDEFLDSIEEGFATSGMTCNSSYEVVGDGLVVSIRINELEDLPEETKQQMQEAYDASASEMEEALEMLQEEVPELEYMTIRICEKDGDLLAEITLGK